MGNWTNEYAKRCGIWQGRCYWHDLRDLIFNFVGY
ncbi:hypothetical protein MBGDN05_00767 [Thermoplasmatales archaeon SCGC AB-539-N05]|nr:hypothetical protein MBGDN05_00767 [Thermoplasmatales archaeon SCGC AB-539-N05]